MTASVTVGMPTYNSARTLDRAIRSLLAQTHTDFLLHVSDDGSRDATVAMVREYAAADPRISLVVQPRNLNYGNFRYLLSQATTPYFAFAAADDWWEPTFLERCIAALESTPTAVCAAPLVQMHPDGDAAAYLSCSTYALTGTAAENVAEYLEGPGDNSRVYGVFRTPAAQRAFPRDDHFGFDWTYSVSTLAAGTHLEVPEVLLHREVTEESRYFEYVRRDAGNAVDRLFPLLPMTRKLLLGRRVPFTRRVLRALVFLNADFHRRYVERYHPGLASLYQRIQSR